jgi:hypothetical protein
VADAQTNDRGLRAPAPPGPEFRDARVTSVEVYADPGDLDPPWDIIGFDAYDVGGGRWRFVLHCDAIEWCFESAWPVVERADAEPDTTADRPRD